MIHPYVGKQLFLAQPKHGRANHCGYTSAMGRSLSVRFCQDDRQSRLSASKLGADVRECQQLGWKADIEVGRFGAYRWPG